jgi:hypothetical protein
MDHSVESVAALDCAVKLTHVGDGCSKRFEAALFHCGLQDHLTVRFREILRRERELSELHVHEIPEFGRPDALAHHVRGHGEVLGDAGRYEP